MIRCFVSAPCRSEVAGGPCGGGREASNFSNVKDRVTLCRFLCVVQVGYLQFSPSYLDVDANLQAVDARLSSLEVDLLVLPELFTSGYFFHSQEDLTQVAEPIPGGRSTTALRDWASSLNATLVAGLAEQDGPRIFNSAVAVQPDGTLDTYRKVHLYYEEKALFTPGDLGFPVVEVRGGAKTSVRLGLMVCFDWYFPESARTLALQGADIIAHPSNLVLPHCPDAMPVRARENHLFTVTANRHGEEEKDGETLTFIGTSEVCDPTGTILKRGARDCDEIGIVNIDPTKARDRRLNAYNDVMEDRRPDMYTTPEEEVS